MIDDDESPATIPDPGPSVPDAALSLRPFRSVS